MARRWMMAPALLASLIGCNEYTYTNRTQVDVFQQDRRNTVDVLLVVDNSCSMIEEQTKLGDNFDAFIQYFASGEADYQIGVVTTDVVQDHFMGRMLGGEDEIILRNADSTLIDKVEYDRSWGITEGSAFSLDPDAFGAGDNDLASAWCLASESYGGGDKGTPGEANPSCGAKSGAPPAPTDTGAPDTGAPDTGDAGAVDSGDAESYPAPIGGQVVITEFMPDPAAVEDSLGEWVEIQSALDETLDLSGCSLSDGGRNAWTFPEGTLLEAGQILVIGRSADSGINGGAAVDLEAGVDLTLQNDVFLLTPDTEGASEIFAEMVAVGIEGSGLEMGLEAARLALSEPMISEDNAGFLRDDANLSMIFVSDEDDMSPYRPSEYLQFFTELKGEAAYRDHALMNISAVVGEAPPEFDGQPSCSSSSGEASYGQRYVEAVARTEGVVESICDEDFSSLAEELGLLVSGLTVEFELSGAANENTLEVSLYSSEEEGSFVGFLEKDVDYSFLALENAIRFTDEQIPPPQYFIKVEYELLANGTVQGAEGDADDTGGRR